MKTLSFALRSICALCLCMCIAAPAFAATQTDPELAGALGQAKAEARTLLEQKKAQAAYDLYARLLREEPDDDEVNFGLARAATLANRPNQAVMAYERLLEKYPNDGLLHRELAHAYTVLGANDLAAQHLALSDASPTEASDVLTQWSKNYDRWQIHGRIRAGLMFDSNANLGPASNTLSLGDWNNVRLSNARAQSTMGAYLGVQLDMGWRFDQVSPWWIVGDAQFYARGNGNAELVKVNGHQSEWARGSIGLRHMGSTHMLDVRLKTEVFDYAFCQNITATGPEATFVYAITPQVQLISRLGADRRTYLLDDLRNGWYNYGGQYVRLLFGESQHSFTVGARYVGGNAKWGNYSYDGWEGTASFTFKLPHKIELSPYVSYTREWYGGPATALEIEKRQDYRWRTGISATIPLSNGWSLEASYQYTQNASSSNLFKYDQHLITTGVAWSF